MEPRYMAKGGKLLRCGYTTGSCAAAAAKGAACLLLTGKAPEAVTISTPAGIVLTLELLDPQLKTDPAVCAVRKDGGDDPDATAGLLICAAVRRCDTGISIDGGDGVGRVTKPGLDQPVGAAAINSTPRRMIAEAVRETCDECGYTGGMTVTISIPGGKAVAKRTFNPRMGIVGGLSVVGTTGIVEPMSTRALVDTVKLELSQLRADGTTDLLLTPGNYGAAFASESLRLDTRRIVTCANFIGDALDGAVELGFRRILLVGHVGKLVKLALNITDTHSRSGDGRMEALLRCALDAGGSLPLLRDISAAVTTDGALTAMAEENILIPAMALLGQRIGDCLLRRVPPEITVGFICFTNAPPLAGVLTQSKNAPKLMEIWR
ncbi:MAG: cobalamin biosynthesis protein CbiD [Clostridiales bacterium]|nr:cobalamin biosynthesis protein CbiD [Clostridiales bacterium]